MNPNRLGPADVIMSLVKLGDSPVLTNCIDLGIDLSENSGQVSMLHPLIAGLVTGSQRDDNYELRAPYGNSPAF